MIGPGVDTPVVVKKPIIRSKTLWLNVSAVVAAGCAVLPQWIDQLPIPPAWRPVLLFLAFVLQSSGVLAARKTAADGTEQLARAANIPVREE